MDLLTESARRVYWKLNLTVMCVFVTLVLPQYTIKTLIESSNPTRSLAFASNVMAMLVFLFAFWRLGSNLPSSSNDDDATLSKEQTYNILDNIPLAFFIRRIGILGVTAISFLSGFGAVYNPYTKLPFFSLPVTSSRIKRSEATLLRSMHLMISKKRRLAQILFSRKKRAGHHQQDTKSIWSSVTSMFSSSSSNHKDSEISRLRTECLALERFHEETFQEIDECRSELRFSERSKTCIGRFYTLCGYVLVVYGIYKVLSSTKNIVLRSIKNVDSMTRSIEIAESVTGMELKSYVDVHFWLQQASFVMMAVMVVTSVRGFVKALLAVFSASSSHSATRSELLCLILAEIMGLYFVAQVMMWRMELPQDYRKVVTQALGENIEFNFYHRWSDEIFLSSSAISALVLTFLHKTRESRVRSNNEHDENDLDESFSFKMP
jgi:golgi pH regulator